MVSYTSINIYSQNFYNRNDHMETGLKQKLHIISFHEVQNDCF